MRDLTRAAYARWVPVMGREPRPMVADYDRAVREHRIDLLEQHGQLLGLVEMIPRPGHLMIENVAVAPTRQGGGLGRWLLARAEQVARELGLPELRLYTNQRMVANLRLYAALGFAAEREERTEVGTVIHMRKSLTPPPP